MKKKNFFYGLALLAALTPGAAMAQSGACGVNVTWQLADSTLTISGEGEMYNLRANDYSYSIYSERVGKVVINEGVTTVGDNAFYGFKNLKSVDLPSSLTDINQYSFYDTPLESVTIPQSVATLGYCSFAKTAISKIEIPAGVKKAYQFTFQNCPNLREVYWDASIPLEDCNSQYASFYGDYITTISFGPNAKYIPSGLMHEVTPGYEIKSSSNIEYIGYEAFNGSKWLADNIAEPVLYFDKCLYKCGDGLNTPTNVTVKEGTVGITVNAFSENRYLVGITIPESVLFVGGGAFYDCRSLSQMTWNAINCKLLGNPNLGKWLSEITFGDKVEEIPAYLCGSCSGLRSLTFPESLKVIGENAFEYCTGIEDIHFNANLDSIASYAFRGCEKLKSAHLTARIIDGCAFYGCNNVSEITISDNVREIRDAMYYYDYKYPNFYGVKLESLTFPATLEKVTGIFMTDGHVNNVYIECEDAYSVLPVFKFTVNNMEFAEGVKTCQNAYVSETLIIPKSVENFHICSAGTLIYNAIAAEGSIYSCENIIIGDGVQIIPKYFLNNCNKLTKLEFPLSVTEIKPNAIYQCSNLESVTAPWYDPRELNVDWDSFKYSASNATLYVPAGREEAYAKLAPWSNFKNILAIDGSTVIEEAAAPTISYVNGELKFSSTTPDAEFHYTITDNDVVTDNTTYGSVYLSACYYITVYASAKGKLNSRTTAAKLYFIDANLDETGIIDVPAKRGVLVATNGPVVKVSGLADYETVEIYDLNGRLAGRGVATDGTCNITVDSDQSILLVHTATETIKIKR